MTSKRQQNLALEAMLRTISRGSGQLYRDEDTSPSPDQHYDAISETSDEMHYREYCERSREEAVLPPMEYLHCSWETIEEGCEPDMTQYDTLTEPTIALDKSGLPSTHSCQYCQHIVFQPDSMGPEYRILVARSRKEFDAAAESGFFLVFKSRNGDGQVLRSFFGEFSDWGADEKGIRTKGSFGDFSIVAEKGSPAANFVRFRPLNLSVSSDNAFSTAAKWLEQCHMEHPECTSSGSIDLPSRVLEITNDYLKIVSTSNLSGDSRYVALSYCWGGPQDQKTTSRNLQERQTEGFNISQLPPTLRDAIVVTKQLGLQFLWVDSLCIVQDDDSDRIREIAKMADIYRGAYLTVSAASTSSVSDGFLQDREPNLNRRRTVPLQFCSPDGEPGWVYFYRLDEYNPRKEDPLNSRGWTLQEHVLSPRLLIYGTWQRLSSKLESRRTYVPLFHEGQKAMAEKRFAKSMHCLQELKDIMDFWPKLVQEFTRRSLSQPSDRAAAINGIANRYARLSEDTYRAGLWALTLAKHLTWKRDSTYEGGTRHSDLLRPSWSWISVDGPIVWNLGPSDRKSPVEVLGCDTSGFEPIGATQDIPLTIKGRIRSAFYSKVNPKILFFFSVHDLSKALFHRSERSTEDEEPVIQSTDLAFTATATFDYPEEHAESNNSLDVVFLLEILSYSDDERDSPAGIILKLGDDEKFQRVGYWDFEWANGVWMTLYDSGSEDHDERRQTFRKEVFAKCCMETITIF
ncbi:HET-domain-containing protein [Cadophora sp. DSE1049]|nr:HET-domain-containing protein [Cadophora sp. DSE1049]